MRKYYYVCPRCGRCYRRFIPRRKTKCGFCSTVWKTRGAKGTRSAFSWTATLTTALAIIAIAFFAGREFGVFSKSGDAREKTPSWETKLEVSSETAENLEAASDENVETLETFETSEDAAAE